MSMHAGASDKSEEAKEVKHEAQDFRFGALEDGLQVLKLEDNALITPRSPGTHIVGPWVIDGINLYRD